MAYRGLTAIGANYLATRLAQELPVEITRVQIGAGTPIGNPGDVSELQNYKLDAKILKKSQENNTLEITIQVVNEDVDQGFYLKEIGVFVNDDTEKLYWYCNEDNAQYIPAKTDSAIAFEIDIKMEVTNVESPILNWSGWGTWVNKDYLEEVLRNYTPNTRQMTAGKGLTGGGNFNSDKTFNVVSANDGIIVNEDNIQLNPVDDLSNSSTTRALAANQGLILDNKDKGIVGGYNGKFPLTSATKGNIYLLENTQKYYICITDYNGSKLTTPNANFEELSVYTNRSKLDNLFEIYTNGYEGYIKYSNGYCKQWGTIREMGTNHEVKLLIPLKDIYYNIQATYQAGSSPTTQSIGVSISIVSKEKIIVNKSQESSKFIAWTVEGFYK